MTTPTRDEVVRLAAAAGSEPAYYGIHETVGRKFYCLADLEAFYNLARADLEATIAEQAAELESLRKDAERYRWLREADQGTVLKLSHYAFDALDKVIDAARAAAPKQEK